MTSRAAVILASGTSAWSSSGATDDSVMEGTVLDRAASARYTAETTPEPNKPSDVAIVEARDMTPKEA